MKNSFFFINNVVDNSPQLLTSDFKWCFINEKKLPFRWDGNIARSNQENDFCDFDQLVNENANSFKGIAISVNFSIPSFSSSKMLAELFAKPWLLSGCSKITLIMMIDKITRAIINKFSNTLLVPPIIYKTRE